MRKLKGMLPGATSLLFIYVLLAIRNRCPKGHKSKLGNLKAL